MVKLGSSTSFILCYSLPKCQRCHDLACDSENAKRKHIGLGSGLGQKMEGLDFQTSELSSESYLYTFVFGLC